MWAHLDAQHRTDALAVPAGSKDKLRFARDLRGVRAMLSDHRMAPLDRVLNMLRRVHEELPNRLFPDWTLTEEKKVNMNAVEEDAGLLWANLRPFGDALLARAGADASDALDPPSLGDICASFLDKERLLGLGTGALLAHEGTTDAADKAVKAMTTYLNQLVEALVASKDPMQNSLFVTCKHFEVDGFGCSGAMLLDLFAEAVGLARDTASIASRPFASARLGSDLEDRTALCFERLMKTALRVCHKEGIGELGDEKAYEKRWHELFHHPHKRPRGPGLTHVRSVVR